MPSALESARELCRLRFAEWQEAEQQVKALEALEREAEPEPVPVPASAPATSREARREEYRRLFTQGLSTPEVANKMGVTKETALSVKKRLGLTQPDPRKTAPLRRVLAERKQARAAAKQTETAPAKKGRPMIPDYKNEVSRPAKKGEWR